MLFGCRPSCLYLLNLPLRSSIKASCWIVSARHSTYSFTLFSVWSFKHNLISLFDVKKSNPPGQTVGTILTSLHALVSIVRLDWKRWAESLNLETKKMSYLMCVVVTSWRKTLFMRVKFLLRRGHSLCMQLSCNEQ